MCPDPWHLEDCPRGQAHTIAPLPADLLEAVVRSEGGMDAMLLKTARLLADNQGYVLGSDKVGSER